MSNDRFASAHEMVREYAELEEKMADPSIHEDQANARKLGRRYAQLGPVVAGFKAWKSSEDDLLAAAELADVDPEFAAEIPALEAARDAAAERLEELLSDFSIEHLRRAPALALSGGERRRVEIARCLAANPRYLLLDEPFAGVDPISVGDIRNLVTELKTRGIGVLITDHNVRETLEIVDRAYILHEGAMLMSGSPRDVVQNENVRRVYLGDNFNI